MKKRIITAISILTLGLGATAIAHNGHGLDEAKVKLIAQKHDMTDYQQELAVQLFRSGKTLMGEVKRPKDKIKSYLSELAEVERIDVEAVMAEYKLWQQGVDQEFEQALRDFATLHENLTVEQRKTLMASFKRMNAHKQG